MLVSSARPISSTRTAKLKSGAEVVGRSLVSGVSTDALGTCCPIWTAVTPVQSGDCGSSARKVVTCFNLVLDFPRYSDGHDCATDAFTQ
jgi:hypothetical protein